MSWTVRTVAVEKRKLGHSSLEFAPIALGGVVFGWTIGEAMTHKLLDAFVDAGFSLVDTAESYTYWAPGSQWGQSETLIGSWLKNNPGKRDKLLIATKCTDLSRGCLRASVESSLARLNTDYIDLFQSHRDDKDVPLEETLSAYGELIKEGKIRYIGASNYDAPRLAEAAKVASGAGLPQYQSLQPHYNLLERPLFEGALEEECLRQEIGVILAKSVRGASETVRKYVNDRGGGVLAALDAAARKHNRSNATVALAWLLHRKSITAPIVSATNLDQLRDLLAAPQLKLDEESLIALDRASAT
jgi:aryl-alcohol dehydrogenase-like predicted oxidoreductase